MLLTGEHCKKLRREAIELMVRKREEAEANAVAKEADELAKTQALHDMAIAIRIMNPDGPTETFQNSTKDDFLALTRTYWTQQYVTKFTGPYPSSWNGTTIERLSSLKKDDLLEYAVIILNHQQFLDNVDEFDNVNITAYLNELAAKKEKKETTLINKNNSKVRRLEREQ